MEVILLFMKNKHNIMESLHITLLASLLVFRRTKHLGRVERSPESKVAQENVKKHFGVEYSPVYNEKMFCREQVLL